MPHLERYESGSIGDKGLSESDMPAVTPDAAHSVLDAPRSMADSPHLECDGAHSFGVDGHAEKDAPRLQPDDGRSLGHEADCPGGKACLERWPVPRQAQGP
jgi:hypothetical protein